MICAKPKHSSRILGREIRALVLWNKQAGSIKSSVPISLNEMYSLCNKLGHEELFVLSESGFAKIKHISNKQEEGEQVLATGFNSRKIFVEFYENS